jgi:hypothetical protein
MAKRDPQKTARNKRVAEMRDVLDSLLLEVLEFTGVRDLQSLNAKIGGKFEVLMKVKERCIPSSEEFVSLYMDGLKRAILMQPVHLRQNDAEYRLGKWYQDSESFRQYMETFLERSFLKHYDEYARVKPAGEDASCWIGQNNAHYGLFITPRFNRAKSEWENDKSEIRKFKRDYFTIGHVLETGLVLPDQDMVVPFGGVNDYLTFFRATLVRGAGSEHQDAVAERYANFVTNTDEPLKVPLLIPELRFLGKEMKHEHRLDFCVIDPYSLRKIGFELSPWSSHGQLIGTKTKKVKDVNEEAKGNYEKDIRKCEAYFDKYDIHVTVFTDADLADPDQLFRKIARYLEPEKLQTQLLIHSREQLLNADLDAEVEDD